MKYFLKKKLEKKFLLTIDDGYEFILQACMAIFKRK